MSNRIKLLIKRSNQLLRINLDSFLMFLTLNTTQTSPWILIDILRPSQIRRNSSHSAFLEGKWLKISFQELLGWTSSIKRLRIISINRHRSILRSNNERHTITSKATLSRNQRKLRMQDMICCLLESIDHAAD